MALIASIAVAYALPLSTLFHAMGYDSPLAYLGLVPVVAFLIGCWQHHRAGATASLALRDAAVGGMLVVLAAATGAGLPAIADAATWRHHFDLAAFTQFAASAHLDLLSLPVFAAGMLVLLYGRTALRWAWPAVAYGFLIWPVPYTLLLGHLLPFISDASVWAVRHVSAILPLGATVDPDDGTLFSIVTPRGAQTVSIGSACSGFNSFVAWLLVGVALCIVVRERRSGGNALRLPGRLALWLLIGAIGTFLGNITRIIMLFAVVHHGGIDSTFGWVHAFLGNGLFALVVLGMLVLLPRLGLALPQPKATVHARPAATPAPLLASAHIWLITCGALALAAGMLLGVTVLRLTFVVLGVYLLGCFAALFVVTRAHGADRPAARLIVTILTATAAAVMVALCIAFWHLKEVRSEQLPSVGWRIDLGQRALITGTARRIAALASAVGAVAAGQCALIALRRHARHARVTGGRPFREWGGTVLAAGAIVAGTMVLGISTVTVSSFDDGIAAERVAPVTDFDVALPGLPGATRTFVTAYDWPRQSLGRSATYNRYQYTWPNGAPLWVDVLTTEDADALAYHDVRSCYAFHGFVDRGTFPLDLGNGGATARIVNYIKPDVNEAWSTLYWEQKITRGGKTFYQRIVLLYYLDLPPDEATSSRFAPNDAFTQTYAAELQAGLGPPSA